MTATSEVEAPGAIARGQGLGREARVPAVPAVLGGEGVSVFIGIDPGVAGALAVICPECGPRVWDTPVAIVKRTRKEYLVGDMRQVLNLLCGHGRFPRMAVLEEGIPMPSQSSRTTYGTGRGGGLWEGLLAGLGIPYERVAPAKWKKSMGLTGQDKGGSRVLAQRLFPAIAGEFARAKDDGRAEAILLAEYRRRQG